MGEVRNINYLWQDSIYDILEHGNVTEPAGSFSAGGRKTKEILGNQVSFDMADPLVTLKAREMNFRFAFGEAWWICSGFNAVEGDTGVAQFMKGYKRFSDDGVTLNGAYGPKFADQISWIVNTLAEDIDSRQAVLNLWRERPGKSKDRPCTLTQQFIVRKGVLHCVTTMRSNDLVWGFCYDAFTFSMMAKMVQTMLRQRGIIVTMGGMTINQGSAHIYEDHWDKALQWTSENEVDPTWLEVFPNGWEDPVFETREDFLDHLWRRAQDFRKPAKPS